MVRPGAGSLMDAEGLDDRKRSRALTARALALLPPSLLSVFGLAAQSASAADRPAICNTPFDPYKATPAVRDECGIKSFPLVSKTRNPDGSTDYRYLVNG